MQYAIGPSQIPPTERQFGLVLFLHSGFAVPGDALPGVNNAAHEPVLESAPESILRELVPQVRTANEEVFRQPLILWHAISALLVQQRQLMQRMRVFRIRLLSSLLQKHERFARVPWLTQQTLQLDDAHFVHGGDVAELGGAFVPLHGFDRVFAGATAFVLAHFAADGDAVGGLGVIGFGGGLVEREGFLDVGLKTERAAGVAVAHVKHSVWILGTRELFENFECLGGVVVSGLFSGFGVGAFVDEDGGCFDELFGQEELCSLILGTVLCLLSEPVEFLVCDGVRFPL